MIYISTELSKCEWLHIILYLFLTSFTYLFTAGVEGFCDFTWSHSDTQHSTVCRTPLDEGSACLRDLSLTTQTLYKTNIHAPGGSRTHDPSKRSAADLRLKPRGAWDRGYKLQNSSILVKKYLKRVLLHPN
jgi:hypothetical protein